MKTLLLTYRYLLFHRWRSFILIFSLTLTLVLPLSVHWLIRRYHQDMLSRATTTPFLVGTKGSPYDQLLNNVYFHLLPLSPMKYGDLTAAQADHLALGIPLNIKFTAKRHPIIGTSLEYFEFRNLDLATGAFFQILGDVVLGSNVARRANLRPGDTVISDPVNVYDISKVYPLKMHIIGVLKESGSADDDGIFADFKTTWIIEGLGHGHRDIVGSSSVNVILNRTEENVTTNESLYEFNEITPGTIDSFHFHGNEDDLPLTGILVVPKNQKAATILKGRYGVDKDRQMLQPLLIIEDLMRIIFRLETIFDLIFTLVALSTMLFLTLVMLLSMRIRQKEMNILFKIGCGRRTMFWMYTGEIVLMLISSGFLATFLAIIFLVFAPEWHQFL